MNIVNLLKSEEGKTLEFKCDFSSPQKVIQTIIAFTNTAGGTVVIGVEDSSKFICGVDNPHKLEERIVSTIYDNIVPHIQPEIDILPWRDRYLIAVRVFPGVSRPYYLKKKGKENGCFIRVGSTNRLADKEIIEELSRLSRNETFDERAYVGLDSKVIDFEAIFQQFNNIRKLEKKDLETLELITNYQGKKVPTNAGLILFGKNREKYFPDAWIHAGRFKGKDKSLIVDSAAFHSFPTLALEQAMEFVKKHAMKSVDIGGLKHNVTFSMPMIAIREAMINAVVHADYSLKGSPIRLAIFDNRIEIDSPGLLRFGLTISDIKEGISKLRNRIIGRVFNQLGLIERWGSGIQRIISTCKQGGFPEPVFEELATHFRVTIFTTQEQVISLDTINEKIITLLTKASAEGLTTNQIAAKIQLSTRATRTRLLKLIGLGLVFEIASSAQDPNRLYFIATI